MECYLAIRRNELLIQVKIWMITIIRKSNLYSIHSLFLLNYKQCINYVLDSMLGSEKSQTTKKQEYIMCDSIICNSRKCTDYSVESRLSGDKGQGIGSDRLQRGISMKDCSFFLIVRFHRYIHVKIYENIQLYVYLMNITYISITLF